MNNTRALARIRQAAQQRCVQIADDIAELANQHAPVDEDRPEGHSGPRLKGSYRSVDGATVARVETGVRYWHYVEYGTSRSRAEPHVRPAIEAVRTQRG